MLARLLVLVILGLASSPAHASEEFPSADSAEMLTPGVIDQSIVGETTIESFVEDGETLWSGGLDLPAGHTLNFDLVSEDSTHWNHVGGDFSAHINGNVVSGPDNTIVFASPFGVFIGSDAVLDVGTLVAVGADVLNHDLSQLGPVLELTGAIENQGLVRANSDVLFYGTQILNGGEILAPNGRIQLLGADAIHFLNADTIAESLIDPPDFVAITGEGRVGNRGRLQAHDIALFGNEVANHGEIEIADGSLMMIGADAIYVRQFGNPVLTRLPHDSGRKSMDLENPAYRVENQGQIKAGLGHVRLAASDPLGFSIRQGSGSAENPASISARRIEIEGGEIGHVSLSGSLDATSLETGETGGQIDITGGVIALVDASIDASGESGGGIIQIGGEQQGQGDLQRAMAVVMDEESAVRADAIGRGDGGRVILFSEDLTSIAGTVSARGGARGGNGGFIETSGLRNLQIMQTPDASAPLGEGGDWLIDPFAINIVVDAPDCPGSSVGCMNGQVEAILAPNFDDAPFDGVLRTVVPPDVGPSPNDLSVDLLLRALNVGTNITLSTEAFNPAVELDPTIDSDEGDGTQGGNGDITIAAPIVISDGDALPGTTATLTLLAAGSIYIDQDILVGDGSATTTSQQSLSIELRANDQSQREQTLDFGSDQLRGSVLINANIRTGGGDFAASGISVLQAAGTSIQTSGGDVDMITGSLDRSQSRGVFRRNSADPENLPIASADPSIRLLGTIDTSRPDDDPGEGGDIDLEASAILISTVFGGANDLLIDTGILELQGTLNSGGGDITLAGGASSTAFAGSVELTGGTLLSGGGNVELDAHRVDALARVDDFDIAFTDPTRGEGGSIATDAALIETEGGTLAIGTASTQRIALNGTFDTTGGAANEDGLISVVALDSEGVNDLEDRYGRGTIVVGDLGPATLDAAGIRLSTREITTASNGDPVSIVAQGSSSASILESDLGIDSDLIDDQDIDFVDEGEVVFEGDLQIFLGADTLIEGERIEIQSAANPTRLNGEETNGLGVTIPAEAPTLTRLTFEGSGGTNAATGVLLQANDISISVGDGTTVSPGFAFEPTEDEGAPGIPNEFGLERGTRGIYSGLQLRDRSGTFRPETIDIRQDGDLTIEDGGGAAPVSAIFFGGRSGTPTTTGAFADASIGDEGQLVSVESSDGILTIEDAAGLSNDVSPSGTGDNGLSRVVLNGGFLLPPDETSTEPVSDSVIFAGSFAGDSAFDVEGLVVSTPRNFTITTVITDAIAAVTELLFVAGRDTGNPETEFGVDPGGTLTVEDGLTLQAGDPLDPQSGRLALQSGATGFGDLVFEGTTTTLAANEIELRAGAGADSFNFDFIALPEVRNVANVTFRTAQNTDFVSTGMTPLAFSLQQDATIDALVHLPTFANFASTPITSFNGPDAITPVSYSLRSDIGVIDLTTDATDGARFTDAALSLIGLQTELSPILVDDDFTFIGPSIEIGSVNDFLLTEALAEIFNPVDVPAEARDRVILRSGLNGGGALFFDAGVVVTAPRIELVSGDGTNENAFSPINVAGAAFDLSDAAPLERTFVFQEDEDFQPFDLPTAAQFVGGLPNILAVRDDGGTIDLLDFDIAALPIDFSVQARLVLEADLIEFLTQVGNDLVLSTDDGGALENLGLRIRTNSLRLEALFLGTDIGRGRVLAGTRTGDTNTPSLAPQPDDAFDDESLLIEAFDSTVELATTTNLSSVSEVEDDPDLFDLATGRGPSILIVDQDGVVEPDELPNRFAISGYLERTLSDEPDGTPIPTTYVIDSRQVSLTVAPDNVSGSNLIMGSVNLPHEQDITFQTGIYDFANVDAYTRASIFVESGVTMSSMDAIVLSAALIGIFPEEALIPPDDPLGRDPNVMGNLEFLGNATTTLNANSVILTAGPPITVTNPDGTNGVADGDRDTVAQGALAEIDFTGLAAINQIGESETSSITAQQNRDFLIDPNAAPDGNLSSAIQNGTGIWEFLDVSSIQGELRIVEPELLAASIRDLFLGRTQEDSTVVIETAVADPFSIPGGFNGRVLIDSNEVRFIAADGIELQLSIPNLRMLSDTFLSNVDFVEERARFRSELDTLERPIVGVEQSGDFSTTTLMRADRFIRRAFDFLGNSNELVRESLSEINIELTTRGDDFVLGDSIRAGASYSNLIIRTNGGSLDANGSIILQLSGLTPGYTFDDFATPDLDALDFAALQLGSLDLQAGSGLGTITVTPFAVDGTPENFTLETERDQRYAGDTLLQETLSTNTRDIHFTGDIYRGAGSSPRPEAGLLIETTGEVLFSGDIGTSVDEGGVDDPNERLGKLYVLFDNDFLEIKPTVQFGRRLDLDGDGINETPITSNQRVLTNGIVFFGAAAINEPDDPNDPDDLNFLENLQIALENAPDLLGPGGVAEVLTDFEIARTDLIPYATVGKSLGNLSFESLSPGDHIVMGSGERISVGGNLDIQAVTSVVTLGDAGALDLFVGASEIGLVARNSGTTFNSSGASTQDGGSSIATNNFDFGAAEPVTIGVGKGPRFGVPNPHDPTLPDFLGSYPAFANLPKGGDFDTSFFAFTDTALGDQVPSPIPIGASRSELTGSFGSKILPRTSDYNREAAPLQNPDRMVELAVYAQDIPEEVMLSRLSGAAVIDDLVYATDYAGVFASENNTATVTEARLDADDAEAAIALYAELFGVEGEHAGEVRATLQDALDRYLEATRARRVIGFELRRFVKNRPSTLLDAYTTLDQLDTLFRYHRRLGLSPGEFRRIQRSWLKAIQPDGITLEELSEAIHPSRYVRGSDILDIFGR